MKRKTSELTGAALDWAVAKCENTRLGFTADVIGDVNYIPSRDWAQGGPIIDREGISIRQTARSTLGYIWHEDGKDFYGPHAGPKQPLIAAMRCYVASKLGEEVDIPEELA